MSERICKVGNYKDGKAVITTSRVLPGDSEKETSIKLYKEPHKDFLAAFDALEPYVREILELPDAVWEDRIRVSGVSFSWAESTQVEGATITCLVTLETANSPLVLNTPHLPFDQYSEGGEQPVMSDEAIDALKEVKYQASLYLDGKTAQGDLFDAKSAAAGEKRPELV